MANAAITKINNAKATLKAAGWNHVCSTMSDIANGTNYGILFSNGKRGDEAKSFYLNIDTVDALPV